MRSSAIVTVTRPRRSAGAQVEVQLRTDRSDTIALIQTLAEAIGMRAELSPVVPDDGEGK